MSRILGCLVLFSGLAAVAPAQARWIVDQKGGPGVFRDLPQALSVASNGDVIRVRAGLYTPTWTTKGVTILGDPGATLNTGAGSGSFVVLALPPFAKFVMKGLQTKGTRWHFPHARCVARLDARGAVRDARPGARGSGLLDAGGPGIRLTGRESHRLLQAEVEMGRYAIVAPSPVLCCASMTVMPMDPGDLARRMRPVLERCAEIAAAWLFGSAARGELRPDSDIDVGVVFRGRGETALDHHRLLGDLASRLEEITAPHPVDLVVLEDQGPIFCHRALIEGKRILETDRWRRIDFESETIVRALDFRPTWEIAARGQVEGMKRWLKRTS